MAGSSKERKSYPMAMSGVEAMAFAQMYQRDNGRRDNLQVVHFVGAHMWHEVSEVGMRMGYTFEDVDREAAKLRAKRSIVEDGWGHILHANRVVLDIALQEAEQRPEGRISAQDIVVGFLIGYKDPVKKIIDELQIDRYWMIDELRGSQIGSEPKFYNDEARRKHLERSLSQQTEGKQFNFSWKYP